MRRPTSPEEAYRWHNAALAHIAKNGTGTRNGPRISENEPQCGWYLRKLVKNGAFVPCRIWLEQPIDAATGELTGPEQMLCEVDGKRRNPLDEWTWICAKPISEDDFMDMIAAQFAGPAEPVARAAPAPNNIIYKATEITEPAAPISGRTGFDTPIKTAF